ncbi:MAG: TonB-dependent receptor [Candidatus Acidiferrales bacterium]
MRKLGILFGVFAFLLCSAIADASIFGNIRGIVHDPQHRPIEGAIIKLQAQGSDWSKTAQTDQNGEFQFDAVPLGEYRITISHSGFGSLEQVVTVVSGEAPVLHFPLNLASVSQKVEVTAIQNSVNPESSTTENTVSRGAIAETPGADRTNSLAMITNYVPSAVMVHDQLHIRGGHQVSWLIDGVPVPNTNIASNVGPQFDPKDIDYLEVQRGGYSAEYGDRTYGVFNVVPRTGFERNREAELVTSFGSLNQTNNQLSFGSHTQRFAYYASLNGNRTDRGLEPPTANEIHDIGSGLGGFNSIIFNATPNDQLRLISSVRRDHYQVPNTPDDQAAGIRDVENERDAFVNFSWLHTAGPGLLLTVSPFYHFNRAHFIGGPNDTPIIPEDDRGSQYMGGQTTLAVVRGKNNARVGFTSFAQRDNTFFGITANDGSGMALHQREILWGSVTALFLEDQFKAASWLTFNGGVRYTHYSGPLVENATNPRIGAAIQFPGLHWVLRGYYGGYYQAPPITTVSGPLIDFALQQGFSFLPLRGERDQEWEVGLAIPFHGWALDTDHFQTRARNFFDHDVLGNSDIFFPLTIDTARIRGTEATLRSPRLMGRMEVHAAFSNQTVEGRGAVSGGLTDFTPPDEGYFPLDHDQRNTLSTGFRSTLPGKSWIAGNITYGSGFLDGNGPSHLPTHATYDISMGKDFGEKWSVQLSGLNLANHRYLIDNSNTFGGTHFADPREIIGQIRYRFHY